MTNWRTTLPGILMLVAGILSSIAKLMSGDAPGMAEALGILGGIGDINSKAKNVTGAGPSARKV